jgi:hypothetical protein
VDIGLRPLSPRGEQILDQLDDEYGKTPRLASGRERLYVISGPQVREHYERHLTGCDPNWQSHVQVTVH